MERLNDLSVVVTDRKGQPLRVFPTRDGAWRLPGDRAQVASIYLDLLLAYEDRRFYAHPGVDPLAVLRALGQDLAAGRVVSGASTLTMQVAHLLEPRPRSLLGKGRQVARALQLEWHFDKRQILDMYLTLAPFGGTLQGIEAASRSWFGKAPADLTVAEAALLVALPRQPSRLRPDRDPLAVTRARDAVLARAVAAGLLDPARAAQARGEAVPTGRQPFPGLAPHLTAAVRRAAPGLSVIQTTLDGDLQRAVEGLARRLLPTLLDGAGMAILVVDNHDATVLAHLGAPDYGAAQRLGWIDMVNAPRSPGSTLKPFIYGLGFDEHIVHPDTVIDDVSTRFGDYAPRNFDKAFHGPVTAAEALQRSLNIPAVEILDHLGPLHFVDALARVGVRLRLPRGDDAPGLPIALGGVGVTLRDVTTLYSALARGGKVMALRDRVAAPPAASVPLFSAESAAQLLDILRGASAPPGMMPSVIRAGRVAVALKTGTSFGFRDAWAVGVTPRFTVGVWVGRPDGTPSPDRMGLSQAAPIVYQVFDLLPGESPVAPPLPPPPVPVLLAHLAPARPQGPIRLPDPNRLQLTFPVRGSVIELSHPDGGWDALAIQATGGRRPLSFLVDGRPVGAPSRERDAEWQPAHAGPIRVTVIDADGRSDAAEVEVR